MDEDKKEKPTTTDTGKGDKPKRPKVLEDLNTGTERLEKANEEKAELLAQEEDLLARKQLSGHAEAGQKTKVLTQDEKDEIEAKKFMQEDE